MRKWSWQVQVMRTTILMTFLSIEPVAAPESAPHVTSGYASVHGLQMYYESHGAANGKHPPLVLLHGGGSTIDTSFGRVLPSLVVYLVAADNVLRPLPSRLYGVHQPVMNARNVFSPPPATLLA
jgi:hypothetical protein